MLGVGPEPWHRRSRLCRRTRVLTRGRVAVAPLLSRRQRALAGDRCTYAPRAVPRCLVGLVGRPWLRGLVGRVVGVVITLHTHQPSAALGFAPLLALSSALSSALSLEASSGGATSSSLASSVIDVDAASSTPVHRAAIVARVRLAAEATAARPDGRRRRICCQEEAPSLSLAPSVVNLTAAASSSPVRWAAIVARTSLVAKAAVLSSSRGAPSPYPNAHVLLARPPYEGGARQICTLCGKGRCLVVVDGGARRIRTPCSAYVGLDSASGHRARGPPGGDCYLVVGGSGFTTYARLAAIDAALSS
jgi:hypothetical protein